MKYFDISEKYCPGLLLRGQMVIWLYQATNIIVGLDLNNNYILEKYYLNDNDLPDPKVRNINKGSNGSLSFCWKPTVV